MSELTSIIEPLLAWYAENKRSLPWRDDPTPYHVWLSEVMLQQTRIEAVLPYYHRFLAACPSVHDLAAIEDDALMKLWQGLGYYSRARNLKKAAVQLVAQYGGEFPADYHALLSLPGVGAYTAGAISSIAFGLPEPAVDGNVLRVIMRIRSDASDITDEGVKRAVIDELRRVYPHANDRAGELTQSIMELGQRICIPNGEPHCSECPLGLFCAARAQGTSDSIPYRAPKKSRRRQQRTVFLICCRDGSSAPRFALRKRPEKGLLAGLWEFPGVETHLAPAEACAAISALCGDVSCALSDAPPASHLFTHVEWHMNAYLAILDTDTPPEDTELIWATPDELRDVYALPSAFRAYLQYIDTLEMGKL